MDSRISNAWSDSGTTIGPGALIPVVGPSGAGKDTLIDHAREWFAESTEIVFPRRLVTRISDAACEDHGTITESDYDRMIAEGDFALTWRAHGLGYIVPTDVDVAIAAGAIVVANISRSAVADALKRYTRVTVVQVTAPREVLAERLKARGRESAEDIAKRLDRTDYAPPKGADMIMIENVGSPLASAAKLINVIESLQLQAEQATSGIG